MTIYDLKPTFQGMLRPITRALARAGVSANQVTLAAMGLSLAVGVLVFATSGATWALFLIPAALFVRMALNAIDGMLAREHDMASHLGAILNELCDVLSDAALYLPLSVVQGMPAHLLVPTIVLAIISEMTGVVAVQIGAQRRYDGPMGKSDRAFVFGVLALLLASGVSAGRWLDVVFWIMLLLLTVTIVNRARRALREAEL